MKTWKALVAVSPLLLWSGVALAQAIERLPLPTFFGIRLVPCAARK